MDENNQLNDNDNKLLGFCYHKKKSVGEIARFLNISPKSVSVRLNKLVNLKKIKVEKRGIGKKTFIRTIEGDKTQKHFVTLLKEIVRRGGEVTDKEFAVILPFNPFDAREQDRFNATLQLPFTNPPLVEKIIRITEAGKQFLKENKS